MMVPCQTAANEMWQKFKAAADTPVEPKLSLPISKPSTPSINKIKGHDPAPQLQDISPPKLSGFTPITPGGGLNPNATTFTPCASPAVTQFQFFKPTTFTPCASPAVTQ